MSYNESIVSRRNRIKELKINGCSSKDFLNDISFTVYHEISREAFNKMPEDAVKKFMSENAKRDIGYNMEFEEYKDVPDSMIAFKADLIVCSEEDLEFYVQKRIKELKESKEE